MAIRILATFPGTADLKGKSSFKDKPDTTEIQVLGWGVSSYARAGVTQGDRAANNVCVNKVVDGISAILMLYAAKGTHIPSAVFELYHKDRTGKEAVFSTITLTDVLVTNVAMSEVPNSDVGSESVSFDYAQISVVAFGKTHTDALRVVTKDVK